MPFFAGVVSLSLSRGRFPWSSCSEDHGDSAVAVFFLVVDAPVAHVVLDMPVVAQRQAGMAQRVQKTVRKYRRCSTFAVVDVAVVSQRQSRLCREVPQTRSSS